MANIFLNLGTKTKETARFMAGPHPVYWLMPWFMILLVLATVEQKNMGLYDAVHTYLYNFILWMGPIPLPGGGTTLVLITISLALKFLFFSPWSWKRSGIILSHLGCLLLLLGGLVTIIDSKEGFMVIPEGEERHFYQDYHNREFVISSQENEIISFDLDGVKPGNTLSDEQLKFDIEIIDKCNNCDIQINQDEDRKSLAKKITLNSKPSELNKEENFSGLTFSLIDKENQNNLGKFIALEDVKQEKFIDEYQFQIIREKTNLPFSIALQDFRKIDYPGTNKASNYQSDLILKENDVQWPVMIEMNKPYRYKGYSIFQSSFDQRDGNEITVLNIVKNSGRLFPYISSFIIFLGLFMHLISRTVRRNQSVRKAKENV